MFTLEQAIQNLRRLREEMPAGATYYSLLPAFLQSFGEEKIPPSRVLEQWQKRIEELPALNVAPAIEVSLAGDLARVSSPNSLNEEEELEGDHESQSSSVSWGVETLRSFQSGIASPLSRSSSVSPAPTTSSSNFDSPSGSRVNFKAMTGLLSSGTGSTGGSVTSEQKNADSRVEELAFAFAHFPGLHLTLADIAILKEVPPLQRELLQGLLKNDMAVLRKEGGDSISASDAQNYIHSFYLKYVAILNNLLKDEKEKEFLTKLKTLGLYEIINPHILSFFNSQTIKALSHPNNHELYILDEEKTFLKDFIRTAQNTQNLIELVIKSDARYVQTAGDQVDVYHVLMQYLRETKESVLKNKGVTPTPRELLQWIAGFMQHADLHQHRDLLILKLGKLGELANFLEGDPEQISEFYVALEDNHSDSSPPLSKPEAENFQAFSDDIHKYVFFKDEECKKLDVLIKKINQLLNTALNGHVRDVHSKLVLVFFKLGDCLQDLTSVRHTLNANAENIKILAFALKNRFKPQTRDNGSSELFHVLLDAVLESKMSISIDQNTRTSRVFRLINNLEYACQLFNKTSLNKDDPGLSNDNDQQARLESHKEKFTKVIRGVIESPINSSLYSLDHLIQQLEHKQDKSEERVIFALKKLREQLREEIIAKLDQGVSVEDIQKGDVAELVRSTQDFFNYFSEKNPHIASQQLDDYHLFVSRLSDLAPASLQVFESLCKEVRHSIVAKKLVLNLRQTINELLWKEPHNEVLKKTLEKIVDVFKIEATHFPKKLADLGKMVNLISTIISGYADVSVSASELKKHILLFQKTFSSLSQQDASVTAGLYHLLADKLVMPLSQKLLNMKVQDFVAVCKSIRLKAIENPQVITGLELAIKEIIKLLDHSQNRMLTPDRLRQQVMQCQKNISAIGKALPGNIKQAIDESCQHLLDAERLEAKVLVMPLVLQIEVLKNSGYAKDKMMFEAAERLSHFLERQAVLHPPLTLVLKEIVQKAVFLLRSPTLENSRQFVEEISALGNLGESLIQEITLFLTAQKNKLTAEKTIVPLYSKIAELKNDYAFKEATHHVFFEKSTMEKIIGNSEKLADVLCAEIHKDASPTNISNITDVVNETIQVLDAQLEALNYCHLKILPQIPKDFKSMRYDSYLLGKKNDVWKFYYFDEEKQPHEIPLAAVPGLSDILNGLPRAANDFGLQQIPDITPEVNRQIKKLICHWEIENKKPIENRYLNFEGTHCVSKISENALKRKSKSAAVQEAVEDVLSEMRHTSLYQAEALLAPVTEIPASRLVKEIGLEGTQCLAALVVDIKSEYFYSSSDKPQCRENLVILAERTGNVVNRIISPVPIQYKADLLEKYQHSVIKLPTLSNKTIGKIIEFSCAVMGSLVGVLAGFCAAGPIGAAGGGVGGAIAGELVGRTINHRWLAHKEENERVHQILTVPARNQSSVDHWAASVSSFFAPKLEQERAKAAEILEKKRQEALSISQPQKNAGKEKKRSLWQRILNQAADTKDPEEKSLHGKKHVTFSNEVVVPEGNDSVPGYSAHR